MTNEERADAMAQELIEDAIAVSQHLEQFHDRWSRFGDSHELRHVAAD